MKQEPRDVLAYVGRMVLQGRAPEGDALRAALLEAGFEAEVIEQALGGQAEERSRAALRRRGAIPIRRLTERATRFLNTLIDLGYIDGPMEDEILDYAMAEFDGDLDLEHVRPHVAAVLFDRQHEMDSETLRLLEEEWRLAFH